LKLKKNFKPPTTNGLEDFVVKQMEIFSDESKFDKLTVVQKEIDDVKHQLLENLDKIAKRGENIRLLEDKLEENEKDTYIFKEGANTLKKTVCQNMVLRVILIIVGGIVLIVVGIVIVCTTSPFGLVCIPRSNST